ncbi:MAG TPA: saccharopine dehydrogenase NADP-binding domain-containing protein [Thermoanaerobaculia bacterium]|nr:saccharopine dehydrogenase NADP-binding domain-containing protein [Thermoanaerobaculia bacterium]
MIYGATGYTGRLLVTEAVRRGLAPVLAGRDAARLAELARPLGLESRAAGLGDPGGLVRALDGVGVVLNAAGPFAVTALPLAAACLAGGAHYLDVTGEIPVFAALHGRDAEARARGTMLMPGVGFIVAPSDCLAAHVARRLPGARRLRLGISGSPLVSRGSARTMAGLISAGVQVRRDGRLTLLPWSGLERSFDYGRGPRPSLAVSWADVYTAGLTTGIPDVEVYLEVQPWERALFLGSRLFAPWHRSPLGQSLLEAQIRMLPEGPTESERGRHRRVLAAEAEDGEGRRACSRLHTPEAYTFTAMTAVEAVVRALRGEARAGFQTPAGVFGADFVLSFAGVVREDLEG